MNTETATNGQIAFNKMKKNLTKGCCKVVFNHVLMDIRMPVMDGFKSTEKILKFYEDMKQQEGLKQLVQPLKIVAVTAYVNIDTEERAKEVGMSKVYNKPLSIDNLLEIVKISTEDSEMEYQDELKYF